MKIRFWGVRSDIPVPGRGTLRYGGHTLCTTVTSDQNDLCILDAGSGLISLGGSLMNGRFSRGEGKALLLISHGAWDHTQGIGFFGPFLIRGNRFTLCGSGTGDAALVESLEARLAPALSPLQSLEHLVARMVFRDADHRGIQWGAIQVESQPLPCGAEHESDSQPLAYRLRQAGRSLVYIPRAEYPDGAAPDPVIAFCRGAHLLIHEAYCAAGDLQPGLGHSSAGAAVDLALRAGIPRLALFHYSPAYDDDQIERMVQTCSGGTVDRPLAIVGAREGLELIV